MKFASPKLRLAVAAAVLGLLAIGALFLLPSGLYEVTDKGRGPGIVPYDSGLIYKVRVLDSLTLYAPDEARPHPDKLTSLVLAAATAMALMTFVLLRAARAAARQRSFFAWASAGLALLTLDETFALHELVGHNLHFLADVPGVERPDDLLFALYAVAVAVFAWHFRDLLLAHPRAVRLFAIGGLFFLIAVASDLAGWPLDEVAEPVAGLCLGAGLVLITAEALQRALDLGPLVAPTAPTAARTGRGEGVRSLAGR
jgi:hypothetical protein